MDARIQALTKQDMDTIALKYPFFKEELHRCRDSADSEGNIFSVGLVAIDHVDALGRRYGETVMKQIAREVVERITGVTGKMGLEEAEDGGFHPVGRVGEGLFGIILPRANLKGAQACAQQIHNAIEFQAIRTMLKLGQRSRARMCVFPVNAACSCLSACRVGPFGGEAAGAPLAMRTAQARDGDCLRPRRPGSTGRPWV